MKTIGQQATIKAKQYFKLYQEMKNDKSLSDRAEGLAKHDFICEKIMNELALEQLTQMINADKLACDVCGKERAKHSDTQYWCEDGTCPSYGKLKDVTQ